MAAPHLSLSRALLSFTALLLSVWPYLVDAQKPEWLARIDDGISGSIKSCAVDSLGNVLIYGRYQAGQLRLFNSDSTIARTVDTMTGCVLAKYSPTGVLLWSVTAGLSDTGTACQSITIDPFDAIFIGFTGSGLQGKAVFYNSVGHEVANYDFTTFNFGVIGKYTGNGTLEWLIPFEAEQYIYPRAMAAAPDGSLYVVGEMSGTGFVGIRDITGTFMSQLKAVFAEDAYLIKFSRVGIFQWGYTIGDFDRDFANAVAVNSSGTVCVAGSSKSGQLRLIDHNFYEHILYTLTYSQTRSFILCFSPESDLLWSAVLGGEVGGTINAKSITTDGGDLIVGGDYAGTRLNFNGITVLPTPLQAGVFVLKISKGLLSWGIRINGGANIQLHSLALGANSTVYAVIDLLSITTTVQNNLQTTLATLTGAGINRAAVIHIDPTGSSIPWSLVLQSNGYLTTTYIGHDKSGAFYVSASSGASSLTFLKPGVGDVAAFNMDQHSSFVARLSDEFVLPRTPTSSSRPASTTAVESSVEENEPSVGELATQTNALTVVAVIISVIFVIGLSVGLWFMKRLRVKTSTKSSVTKRDDQTRKVKSLKSSTHSTSSNSLSRTQTNTTMNSMKLLNGRPNEGGTISPEQMTSHNTVTWLPTKHELSIPAFLEMQWNVDFYPGDLVARGGGGELFRCTARNKNLVQRSGNTPLIMKRIAESMDELDERNKKAFWQELALMWRFRDVEYFCKAYAYSTRPLTIVMKMYSFGDMDDFIYGNARANQYFTYTKHRLVKIFKQYCTGICFMHMAGFVHCDIKPANVLLDVSDKDQDLIPIITDFGISRVLSTENLEVRAFGVVDIRGASVSYAAPDVLFRFRQNRKEFSPEVWKGGDVYALSMTLLEMMKRVPIWLRR